MKIFKAISIREILIQGPTVTFTSVVAIAKDMMQMSVPLPSLASRVQVERRTRDNQLKGVIYDKVMTSMLLERDSMRTINKRMSSIFLDDAEKLLMARFGNIMGLNGYFMQPEILRQRYQRAIPYGPHPHVNQKDLDMTRCAAITGTIFTPLAPAEQPFLNML
jgi:hypothetical protein